MTWCISRLGEIYGVGYCMILLFMILLDIVIGGSVLPASTEITLKSLIIIINASFKYKLLKSVFVFRSSVWQWIFSWYLFYLEKQPWKPEIEPWKWLQNCQKTWNWPGILFTKTTGNTRNHQILNEDSCKEVILKSAEAYLEPGRKFTIFAKIANG